MNPADQYKDATREELLAVVAAADARWRLLVEWGDEPFPLDAVDQHEDTLDEALIACPGTSANLLYAIVGPHEEQP